MNSDEPLLLEFDDWQWHTEGKFPKDQRPEQGYVHIGMFLAWLIEHDMVDPKWIAGAGVKKAVAAIKDRSETPCALRDMTEGRLTSEMLTAEGTDFSAAYYGPQYGYTKDWQRAFRRDADKYAVPEDWDTYDRIARAIDYRYAAWVESGKPELMHMPGILGSLLTLWRSKGRKSA